MKTSLNKTELLKVLPVEEAEIWHILSILLDPDAVEYLEYDDVIYHIQGIDCSIVVETLEPKDTDTILFDDNGYARKHYAEELYEATRDRMKIEKRAMTNARNHLRMNEYSQRYRETKRLQELAQGFRDAG